MKKTVDHDSEDELIEPLEKHNHEKTKRATRRLKKEAKKQRIKSRIKNTWGDHLLDDPQGLHIVASKHTDNPAHCSCYACGHKRQNQGPPISEKRILQEKPEDQLE